MIQGLINKIMHSKLALIAIGLVLAFVLISGTGLLTFYGTTTGNHSIQNDYYASDNPTKLMARASGQLTLNKMKIACGWAPSGAGSLESEAVSVDFGTITLSCPQEGNMGWAENMQYAILSYWYEWYIDGQLLTSADAKYGESAAGKPFVNPGDTYEVEGSDCGVWYKPSQSEQWYDSLALMTDPDIYIIGDIQTGILTCSLKASYLYTYDDIDAPDIIERGTVELAYFNVKLESGAGHVLIGEPYGLPDVVSVGSEVKFTLRTGASNGAGWTCWIHPPATRYDLDKVQFLEDGFTGQDGFGPKTVGWTVPANWFTLGGDNQCTITLHNGLFETPMTKFFVVDDISLIPSPGEGPTGVINEVVGNHLCGSPQVIYMSAVPNAQTGSPISYFVVYAYYGDIGEMPGPDFMGEFMLYDYRAMADANGNGQATFLIPSGKPGKITVKVNAVDEAGRASMGDWWSCVAGDPNSPYGDGEDWGPVFVRDWGMILIILVVGMFSAIALWFAPIPIQYRYIAVLIALAAMCVLAYYTYSNPRIVWELTKAIMAGGIRK